MYGIIEHLLIYLGVVFCTMLFHEYAHFLNGRYWDKDAEIQVRTVAKVPRQHLYSFYASGVVVGFLTLLILVYIVPEEYKITAALAVFPLLVASMSDLKSIRGLK